MTAKDKHEPGEPLWQTEVRKVGGEALVQVLNEIRACQDRMATKINGIPAEIEGAIDAHINKAFAGGDPDGHRRAHEQMMLLIEEKRRLRVAVLEKTIPGLVWAVIVWLGYSAFEAIRKAVIGG